MVISFLTSMKFPEVVIVTLPNFCQELIKMAEARSETVQGAVVHYSSCSIYLIYWIIGLR